MMELAEALEKKGDWAESVEEYHKAALLDASADYRTKITRMDAANPQIEYKKAQERLRLHIAALKSGGKSAEAVALEARVHNMEAAPNLSEKVDAAMQAGVQANRQRHFDEALKHFQEAVELAEKTHPHDQRLATALDYVGNEYLGQDPAAAEAAYERASGDGGNIWRALREHGHAAAVLGSQCADAARLRCRREVLFSRGGREREGHGEGSNRVAASLLDAASVYMMQQNYGKAEPYVLRAVHIDESCRPDGIDMLMPLNIACTLYDKWGKPDKLEPYIRQLLAVAEKQFGPISPQVAPALTLEAQYAPVYGTRQGDRGGGELFGVNPIRNHEYTVTD